MRKTVRLLELVCVVTCCCALLVESVAAQAQPTAAGEPPPPPPPPAAAPPPAAVPAPATPPPPAAAAPQYMPPPPGYGPPGYGPPPPGYDYRYARPHRPRRSRGMMIAGIALFGASYLAAAIPGAAIGSADNRDCDCDEAYRALIPIAGPLTLLNQADSREARHVINTFLIIDTVMQSAGLVLTIFGIMRYVASGHDEPEEAMLRPPPFTLGVAPLPGGGGFASFQLRL